MEPILPSEDGEDLNPEPMKLPNVCSEAGRRGCGGESDSLEKTMRKRTDEEEEEEGDGNPV